MSAISDVKITVLKKLILTDILKRYGKSLWGTSKGVPPISGACPMFNVGKEFIVEEPWMKMPEGFCSWAWADMHREITTLAMGGNFPWMKERGTHIACCTDGFRPVIFKLERVTK